MNANDPNSTMILRIRNNLNGVKPTLIMLGLGRLQLGLIGPVFFNMGYHLVGVNLKSKEVTERLRLHNYYRVIDNPPYGGVDVEVVEVHHYEPTNQSEHASEPAIEASAKAQIINCAFGVSTAALKNAACFLLQVEQFRRSLGITKKLFITCSDNPVGTTFAVELLKNALLAETYQLANSERIAIWNDVAANVCFVPSLADRICSQRTIPPEEIKPVSILTESYKELDYAMPFLNIKPLASKQTKYLGEAKLWINLELARQRKVYTLNMAHAVAAYIGAFDKSNPYTIADALKSDVVRSHVEQALEEVAKAFTEQNYGLKEDWFEYAGQVLERISNEHLDDPISRVARDVPRKLKRTDRLVGSLLFVLRTRFKIVDSLLVAILHALLYAYSYDGTSNNFEKDESTQDLKAKILENGVAWALVNVCGFDSTDPAEKEIADRLTGEFEVLITTR